MAHGHLPHTIFTCLEKPWNNETIEKSSCPNHPAPQCSPGNAPGGRRQVKSSERKLLNPIGNLGRRQKVVELCNHWLNCWSNTGRMQGLGHQRNRFDGLMVCHQALLYIKATTNLIKSEKNNLVCMICVIYNYICLPGLVEKTRSTANIQG